MADDLNQLMKPSGASPAGDEPVIHVIPDKFFGAALKKNVNHTPPPQAAMMVGAGGSPVPPPPPDDLMIPTVQPKKRSKLPVVIIIVLFLMLGGLAAYYFLVLAKAPSSAVNNNVAVNVTPKGAVCGDAKCESPETYASCSADCPAPAPACGDLKCNGDETHDSCPADCAAPSPSCGDNKCEAPIENADSCPDDCKPPAPTVGVDTDTDGLSDEEEAGIYHTNAGDPNTDKDSFVDLNEVLNLFDPAKAGGAMLRDNPGIAVYQNPDQKYEIFKPAAWVVREEDQAKLNVFFTANTGEYVQVLMQDKGTNSSVLEWYLAQSPGISSSQVVTYKTRQGYDALISPDQMVHYVDFGNHVAVITYNVGQRNALQYKVTFQMMVQSLHMIP